RLETLPARDGRPEQDCAAATLCYGEDIRLDFHDPRAFFLLPDGEPVRLKRHPREVDKLLAQLLAFGFVAQEDERHTQADTAFAAAFPGLTQPAGMYGLPSAEDWESFMRRGRLELEAEGWTVRFPHDFRHHFLEAESWEAELREGASGAHWFSLDMGVVVAGQRLSLAPLLADLFTRDPRWLDAQYITELPVDAPVDLMTANHARLRVPAGRLKNIALLLIDLFDNYRGGALRVSRFDAARLEMFTDTRPAHEWRFSGATSALKLAQKLKDSQGVKPVEPPVGLKISLRDYQKTGLAWLQYLRAHELGGILADDMGLGKTAQALAHLLLEKEAGRLTKPALVVLPTSLLFNWQSEAARFAPDLRIVSLHGQDRKARFADLAACDVALTTYPLLWRDAAELKAREYSFLVLDEAQTVKNARGKSAGVVRQLKAEHRLCLTGTPLENHLGELWAQFDFLLPGFLGDTRAFTRLWRLPIEKNGDTLRRDLLARRVAPFILRRKKEEVAKELPPKNLIVRTVALEGGQRDLYETVRAAMDEKVRAEIARLGLTKSRMVILDALLKLRQVCCDPRLVPFAAAQKVKERAKLQLLMDMLPELVAEGRKVLIFSQFTSMLALIEEEITAAGIDCLVLTGQTQDRETPVRAFQAGQAPVFLISLKAGGLGLNLTAADTVIHYDPWWNPAVETQADDRAHRIGQDKTVFVYKLIVAGSIEEKILALQQEKAQLAAGILSESQSDTVKFSESDIAALLEPLGS
ncbi:MAG: DEAD/DEAH box helicase, partial [Zoogloeaceae bacterium]|nr:DEAD/DEAH box helicase [Zoogloeaceae bacterium]